ncbi:MAG: hypothetical protein JWP57_3362 [Spirosoma sp.]|nr:hypothetical protein [Spirosoma sp.]
MIKRLQIFFYRQPPVARLTWALMVPIVLYLLFFNEKISVVGQYTSKNPFDLSQTGVVWGLYVVLVGFLEYCVCQPPSKQ